MKPHSATDATAGPGGSVSVHPRRPAPARRPSTRYEAARGEGAAAGVRLYVEKDNDVAQHVYRALGIHEVDYRLCEE